MTSASVTRAGRETARTPDRRRRTALALLAVAQLMLVLDVTVVNVALPDIGTSLRLTRAELPWVMTAYTVLFGGLMLMGGRAADRFGARRLTLIGLVVFIGASLLSGLAAGPAALLAGRALQGAGAALLSPAALATVMTMFTGKDRARALGVWSGLAGLGSALGVILGGVLTTEASWRWIFTINVPIGAALLIAVPLVVPAVPAGPGPGRAQPGLDIPGGAARHHGDRRGHLRADQRGDKRLGGAVHPGRLRARGRRLGGVRAGGAADREPAARRRAAAAPPGRGGRLPDADRRRGCSSARSSSGRSACSTPTATARCASACHSSRSPSRPSRAPTPPARSWSGCPRGRSR